MDGAVRLLNGRALQLAAQAGFDVGQILLPQCLLLGFFGLGQAGGLALFGQVYVSALTKLASISDVVNLVESVSLS